MLDTVAHWIGYTVLCAGGGLLAAISVGLAGWAVVEWWYRRFVDLKLLREFLQWKRGRYPG